VSQRTYEALYIVHPELDDDAIQTIVSEAEALVTGSGGTIVRSEIWGKRKLAYPVQQQSEGCYVLLRFTSEPEFIAKLEQHMKLSERIIRYLIVHFDEHTLKLEAEQLHRNEEALRQGARRRDDDDDDDDDDRGGRGRRDGDDRGRRRGGPRNIKKWR